MEDGIGRRGYRLIAFLLAGLGAVGLTVMWFTTPVPRPLLFTTGAGLVATSLLWLLVLDMVMALTHVPRRRRKDRKKQVRTRPNEIPPPPVAEPDYEFTPPVETEFQALAQRADTYSPLEAGTWPDQREPVPPPPPKYPQEEPDVVAELGERYTRHTPMVRSILEPAPPVQQQVIREVTAKAVDPRTRAPAGTTLGRCGGCNTVLLAPTQRPLRLKCPRCTRVTVLKA